MEPYVSAFAPGQSYRSIPYARIPLSEAREMVAEGFAKTVNRGRSIEFFALTMIKLRDRSCSWSHRLMELIGEGNYAAGKMLEWLQPSSLRWSHPALGPLSEAHDYEMPMDTEDGELLQELYLGVSA